MHRETTFSHAISFITGKCCSVCAEFEKDTTISTSIYKYTLSNMKYR